MSCVLLIFFTAHLFSFSFFFNAASVECPAPPQTIPNGNLLGEVGKYSVGMSIAYICKIGYKAVGSTMLTCQATGAWNSAVPNCVGE
jgi:hypothetical protein